MQVARYIISGLFASLVHFAVLVFNMQVLEMSSAGMANLIAACFGISTSFLGSRYYVFRAAHAPVLPQALSFGALYALLALAHGFTLYLWTDRAGLDYRLGFLVATGLQVVLSYAGNKSLVFRQ